MSRVIRQLRQVTLAHDRSGLTDGQLLACFVDERDEVVFAALLRRHGPMAARRRSPPARP